MSKSLNSYLWVEKFRPKSLKHIILPDKYMKYFESFISDKQIPNLLLHSSSPGTGKSTISRAICNDLDVNTLYINMSSEGGIDLLRNQIKKFASVKSIDGRPKVVIADEIDGSSASFQAGLRAFMEEFHNSCRFILTCNYLTKIIEPIKSRCQIVYFDFSEKGIEDNLKPKIIKRLSGILKSEKVNFDEETLSKIVNTFYPDIRRMISLLQQYSKTTDYINDSIFDIEQVNSELYKLILDKKVTDARKYMTSHSYNYGDLYRDFFDNFVPLTPKEKHAEIITILAEYMYRHGFVTDPEINFVACILEILSVL